MAVQFLAGMGEEVSYKAATEPLNFWIVLAWWHGGWWKLFPDLWMSHKEAEQAARELDAGWHHRKVVHITEAA